MAVIWWGWRVFVPPGWISKSGASSSLPPLLPIVPSAIGFLSSDDEGMTMRETTPPCDPASSSAGLSSDGCASVSLSARCVAFCTS